MADYVNRHPFGMDPSEDQITDAVAEAKKVYEKYQIPSASLKERIQHVVQSAFNGRRIVIFSGGEAKGTEDLLAEVAEIAAGGGFGSIMGRNAFQRPKAEAVQLLRKVMDIHAKAQA